MLCDRCHAEISETGRLYAHTVPEHGAAKRPWVARITGIAARRMFRREFVRPLRDYRDSSKTMRGRIDGVKSTFLLEDGWVCEFYRMTDPWKRSEERFFARVRGQGLEHMDREEVVRWLRSSRHL